MSFKKWFAVFQQSDPSIYLSAHKSNTGNNLFLRDANLIVLSGGHPEIICHVPEKRTCLVPEFDSCETNFYYKKNKLVIGFWILRLSLQISGIMTMTL